MDIRYDVLANIVHSGSTTLFLCNSTNDMKNKKEIVDSIFKDVRWLGSVYLKDKDSYIWRDNDNYSLIRFIVKPTFDNIVGYHSYNLLIIDSTDDFISNELYPFNKSDKVIRLGEQCNTDNNIFDKILHNTIDFDPDIKEIISDNFWDLIEESEPIIKCPHEWSKINKGGY